MKRKALLICYYFPPLGLGGVGRPINLFKGLPRYGWDCDVLTVKPVTYRAYEPELLEGLDTSRIHRAGSHDPQRLLYLLGIRRVKAQTISKGRSVSGRFFPDSKIGWVKAAVRKGKSLCERNRYDVIISTSPPVSSHLIGRKLGAAFGLPWVADFRDFWTIYKVEEAFEDSRKIEMGRELLENIRAEASAITAVNASIARYLQKGETITNGYNAELAELWRQPPTGDRFTIGLLGHLHDTREISPLFDLFERLKNLMPERFEKVRLLQVGQVDETWLRGLLKDRNLDMPADILGRQSRRDTIRLLSGAHLFYMGLSDKEGTGFLPGRTFELVASGRPLVAYTPPDSEVGRLVAAYDHGCCFTEDTLDETVAIVEKHIQRFEAGTYEIDPLSEYAQQFSSEALVRKFAQLLDGLV